MHILLRRYLAIPSWFRQYLDFIISCWSFSATKEQKKSNRCKMRNSRRAGRRRRKTRKKVFKMCSNIWESCTDKINDDMHTKEKRGGEYHTCYFRFEFCKLKKKVKKGLGERWVLKMWIKDLYFTLPPHLLPQGDCVWRCDGAVLQLLPAVCSLLELSPQYQP